MPGRCGSSPPLFSVSRHVQAQLADHARGVAVGADAEGILVAQLEQVGDLVEAAGDVGVVDGHQSVLTAIKAPGAQAANLCPCET